ncbi:MAG: site-specific integrase, partial [Terricaulis sp.]
TIPLSAPALAILNGRVRSSEYVFPSPLGHDKPANSLSKNWQSVRAAAGLSDVRLHDLRHTLASLLVARGASLPMIGKILGHASAQTTQRYAHLAADPLRALVDDASAHLFGDLTQTADVIALRKGE